MDPTIGPEPAPSSRTTVATDNLTRDVQASIDAQRLDQATALIMQWAEQRIEAGDDEVRAVQALLRHFILLICRMPPLAHLDRSPLRPDDRLYACFDQTVALIRRQDDQMRELLQMLSELV